MQSSREFKQALAQIPVAQRGGISFDGPATPIPHYWPCLKCPHDFERHVYMYTINGTDFFECTKCKCGAHLRPQIAVIPEGATEADVERIMLEMGAQ